MRRRQVTSGGGCKHSTNKTSYNKKKKKQAQENKTANRGWKQARKINKTKKDGGRKGKAEKQAENLSDAYFESRPDGSKLGAWASDQSTVVASRKELEESLSSYETAFKGKDIKRPQHWGGYIIKPISVEFWQGRPNRLHDRIRYHLNEDFSWKIERLAP